MQCTCKRNMAQWHEVIPPIYLVCFKDYLLFYFCLFLIEGCFWRTQIYTQNQNIMYSFLSFFCCLSSVTCARLTMPWWRQANVKLKLLLKQHVPCARKKTHGTASQPCLNLKSLLEIFCYVWPFLLWGGSASKVL